MHRLIITCLIVNLVFSSRGQIISGQVVDAKTQEPLPYVHIGVPGKNMGTISRHNGEFHIDLSKASKDESLSFSMVGYETNAIAITTIEGNYLKVSLTPKTYLLQEVAVNDSEIINLQKFGRYQPTKTTTGHSGKGEFGWGGEWGLRIYHNKLRYQIYDVNLHLRFNTVDSILFRINIYELDGNLPGQPIPEKEIFVTAYKREKWIKKDLVSENLIVDEDIIVTFELVRIWYSGKGENHLFYTHGKGYERGGTYSRESSFDKWAVDKRPPITLFVSGRVFE